jgi:hypothetical protein
MMYPADKTIVSLQVDLPQAMVGGEIRIASLRLTIGIRSDGYREIPAVKG